MPIDVATGVLRKEIQEIRLPGKIDLTWGRTYRTSALSSKMSPLGRGWTNAYFCELSLAEGGYQFRGPDGGIEHFADPTARVEKGELIINFAAFLDLCVDQGRYVVRSWSVETGTVVHYVFGASAPGTGVRLQSIETPAGHALDLRYDSDGRLIGIVQRLERRQLSLHYDRDGCIDEVRVLGAAGESLRSIRYQYSGAMLIAAADPAGLEDQYEYDSEARMIREIVKDGGVFAMRYDARGRCIFSSGLNRYDEKSLRFYDAGGLVELRDSLGALTRYVTLRTGQVANEIDALGFTKQTKYDEAGRIAELIDEVGGVTAFEYDAAGNRSGITNAKGEKFLLTYNDARLPTKMIDPAGGAWHRRYDQRNLLVADADPSGAVWTYNYDADGNMVTVTNPLGATKSLHFRHGILIEGTDWKGQRNHYAFDALGNLVKRVDADGRVVRIGYDVWGNLAEHRAPDGSVRRMQYDPVGNMIEYVDADGATTRWTYGACGLLQSLQDADGSNTRFSWSTEPDRLLTIRNQAGEELRYVHDLAGNIIEEIGFDGRRVQYTYDPAGRCVEVINGNDEHVILKPDPLGRVVSRQLPDGEATTYDFDGLGNLVAAANSHIKLQFDRDPVGRLLKEVQGPHWVSTLYDAVGRITSIRTDLGFQLDYDLDENGDPRSIDCNGARIEIERDGAGQEIAKNLFGVARLVTERDPVGRPTDQILYMGTASQALSTPLLARTYRYLPNGYLSSLADSNWSDSQYHFDAAGHLTRVDADQGASEWFEYTSKGDLASRGDSRDPLGGIDFHYSAGGRLQSVDGTSFSFDPQGRLIEQGRITEHGVQRQQSFRWSANDQLIAVEDAAGGRCTYAYDPLGRRISKQCDGKPATAFVWNRDCLVHELRGSAQSGWVFETENLAPLAKTGARGVQALVCDHLGTPIAAVQPNGVVGRAAKLTAWGETASDSHELDCDLRFQGQYFDSETGLHYSRFRYYAPQLARFISQDPIGIYGGLNYYAYVTNPIAYIDPYGLSTSSDSQKLGDNLTGQGQGPIGSGRQDAHHIVLSNSTDPRMVEMRQVMSDHGIDINDPRNGIWLPKTTGDRATGDDRTCHKGEGVHGDAYKQYVYDQVMAGAPPPPSKRAVLARLKALKTELAQGKKFACKR